LYRICCERDSTHKLSETDGNSLEWLGPFYGPDELDGLLESWRRHLRAQRISPATISTYSIAVGQLTRFLARQGMPTAPTAIRREHVEAFITDILAHWKPATAHNR